MNLIAVDPGGHTGVSLRLGEQVLTAVAMRPQQLWDLITPTLDEVVYERFATSGTMDHHGHYTVELCGSIQGRVYAINEMLVHEHRVLSDYGKDHCSGPDSCPCYFKAADEMKIREQIAVRRKAVHQIDLIRHEPQNRVAFLKEAWEMVRASRKATKEPFGPDIEHEVDATAHRLAREELGDKVRRRDWGLGISNA